VYREKVDGPFFFTETTVTGDSYLDMLKNWLLPQLNTNYEEYILQQDKAPPIFTRMYECFSIVFFHSAGSDVLPWPPRSPDLTPCDFFPWGFVKDSVYMSPLPTHIQELHDRITQALQAFTADREHRVWNEFGYRVDVCRVT
jgi:hypothetical protein